MTGLNDSTEKVIANIIEFVNNIDKVLNSIGQLKAQSMTWRESQAASASLRRHGL